MLLYSFIVSKSNILLERLDCDFRAMPMGIVESEVFSQLGLKEDFTYFKITNSNTIRIENAILLNDQLEKDLRIEILKTINFFKTYHKDFINYSAFELVNLCHTWYCWNKNYKPGESNPIPIKDIQEEYKIYRLF